MRTVSLLPSASEIVCALGLGGQLVAVSHECDYPAEVTRLPRITSSILGAELDPARIDAAVVKAVQAGEALYRIDGDMLRDLAPDLILTQGVCDVCAVSQGTVAETLTFLPEVVGNRAQTLTLSAGTFAGILRDMRSVARAAGVPEAATSVCQELENRWERLRTTRAATGLRVLMLEWPDPPFYGGHWVPEMVEVAGAQPLLGQTGQDSERVSWDTVKDADPDIIVVTACGYGLEANAEFAQGLYTHPETRTLRAVQREQVWACDANSYFSRPGPRTVRGAEMLRAIFTGEGRLAPSEARRIKATTQAA